MGSHSYSPMAYVRRAFAIAYGGIRRIRREIPLRIHWKLRMGTPFPTCRKERRTAFLYATRVLKSVANAYVGSPDPLMRDVALAMYRKELALFRDVRLRFKKRWDDPRAFLQSLRAGARASTPMKACR